MKLDNLPFPNVIEELNFNELLKGIKELFKSYLNDDEISLLESDRYSALLETLAYRELLLRARINEGVKSMLLPYALGSDLDNVVAIYGIERLKGEKPTADIELCLSTTKDSDTIVPAKSVFRSEKGDTAILKDSVTIKQGELKAIGKIILDEFIKESAVKCELIQTPLPFVLKAKQTLNFTGGADKESDERLRNRAVLSLERFSTAGSAKAYIYQALSANTKVQEVSVLNGGPGIVNIYLKTSDMSEETRASVEKYLSDETVRPLTDKVNVKNATIKEVTIRAKLELNDLFLQAQIDKDVKASRTSLGLGEDLNLSYIYSILKKNGVYRVNLSSPAADIKVSEESFIKISFELSYAKADL